MRFFDKKYGKNRKYKNDLKILYKILIRNDLNSSDEFNANNSVKTNKNSDLYDYNDENGVSILYLV